MSTFYGNACLVAAPASYPLLVVVLLRCGMAHLLVRRAEDLCDDGEVHEQAKQREHVRAMVVGVAQVARSVQ